MTALVVVATGWATSIQDGGRDGFAGVGVSPSGALDVACRDLLNRLVGNRPDAAVLETLGGLVLRATTPAVVANSADLAATVIGPGETITVAPAAGDLWGYLAVRGGIDAPAVLGSRSQDSRSALGPPPVVDGTRLPVGPDPGTALVVDQAPPVLRAARAGVWPGPRRDWFVADAFDTLVTAAWTVTGDVSRVGARLDGPPLARSIAGELASEAVLTGAIQVPPDGRPVVMLADHPTTGGYPVIAVVDPGTLVEVVQARPGTTLRFHALH